MTAPFRPSPLTHGRKRGPIDRLILWLARRPRRDMRPWDTPGETTLDPTGWVPEDGYALDDPKRNGPGGHW